MLRKLISLSLVAVMLSVTAFAAGSVPTFSEVVSDIEYVTETAKVAENNYLARAKHENVAGLLAWDGTAAERIIGGSGTADDPYLISDGAELAYFANAVNGKLTNAEGNAIDADRTLCAKLDRDINLNKVNWEPFAIGSVSGDLVNTGYTSSKYGYEGTFDGQGHNIYNFKYSKYYASTSGEIDKHGMFRAVAPGGKLKNFNLIDVEAYMGGAAKNGTNPGSIVCGVLNGEEGKPENTCIENIFVSGKAYSKISSRYLSVYGSIAGVVKHATVRNCFSAVDVDLSGINSNNGVFSTTYSGTASSATSSGTNAGKKEKRSYASEVSESNVAGTSFGVGGVIGLVHHDRNNSILDNLGNSGEIKAPKNTRVGGVIGSLVPYADSSKGYGLYLCGDFYNYGDVYGDGLVAGVVGHAFARDSRAVTKNSNWYNTGNVYATYERTDVSGTESKATYAAGICNFATARGTGYFYSMGNVSVGSDEHFNESCGLITTGNNGTSENQVYNSLLKTTTDEGVVQKWTTANTTRTTQANETNWWSVFSTTNSISGVGKTPSELSSLTTEEVRNILGNGYVANPGINDIGTPVLVKQLEHLMLDESTYEIAKYTNSSSEAVDKNLGIKVKSAGKVVLDVDAIIEGTSATLEVYDKAGANKLGEIAVSNTGRIYVPTYDATEILIKAAEGSRVLVKEGAAQTIEEIVASPIKVNLENEGSATIVIALFNGTTLEKVEYLENVASVDNYVSGVIDLTGLDVAGRTLKAYLWENGTLAPIGTVQGLQ